jgi:hypothetical protein
MKFLLTKELGRLAKWLRICGFDAKYCTESKTGTVMIAALKEDRMILTRNHRMPLGRGIAIMQVRADSVKDQLIEVCRSLNISPLSSELFSRCTVCNELLQTIDKSCVKDTVPVYVFETQDKYFSCPKCKRIYWQGTHWQSVVRALSSAAAN